MISALLAHCQGTPLLSNALYQTEFQQLCLPWCQVEQALDQTVKLLVILDAMTLIWHNHNVIRSSTHRYPFWKFKNLKFETNCPPQQSLRHTYPSICFVLNFTWVYHVKSLMILSQVISTIIYRDLRNWPNWCSAQRLCHAMIYNIDLVTWILIFSAVISKTITDPGLTPRKLIHGNYW